MNENSYHSLGRNPHQIIRDGSFATKKEFIHNELFHHHIVQHNIVIQGLLKKLHASLIHQKVPDFYGYFFMGQLTLCSEDRIADSINREIQLLKGKKSHFHLIMRHIETRETCLRAINQCLDSLFEQVKPAGLIKLGEELKHLRQLTVWAIQQIKEWKKSLLSLSANVFEDEHISFFYQGEDYLLKILKDTDFIAKSFLAQKVTFSYKQDPFLMRPCTNQVVSNDFTAIFHFEPQKQQQYIACLQFLADERADYLKRKIMAKSDKIKEIERVYQTKQLNQRIMATKANPIALRKAKISINDAPIDFIDETKEEDAKKPIRSNSLSTLRESKMRDIEIKGQKIKKIRQMEYGSVSPLINIKKFNSLQSNANPLSMSRSISLGLIRKRSSKRQPVDLQKQSQTDFESLVRKKELQVMENDSVKRRTISSIRLKDKLSQRKPVDNKEGAQELRKILQQIQHSSPQQQQALFSRRDTPSRTGRTLLQQNQQIMITLRQSILKEIADDTAARQKAEQQKRQENSILQKLVKTKLDQDTLSHIQKQKAKWTLGRDVLAHDIDKRQLFDLQQPALNKSERISELEQDLKREMQLKFLREVHQQLSHREALFKYDKQKKKEQKQRQKELQVVLRKQEQELRFNQIEKEEKGKAMQALLQEQERKKRQIEKQMQQVIEKQQQRLIIFSSEQKAKLEADLRQDMKKKLLISLKKEKSVIAAQKEAQQRQRLMEEAHRAEVRKKMEEEFQVEKQLERQRQRQDKARKLRLVAQKMDHLSQEQQQAMLIREQSLKQETIQQLKQNITKLPATGKVHQQSKRKLREQFQLELFAFNRPENYNIQQNNLLIKDYKGQIENDQNLNKKFNEAEEVVSQKESTVIVVKQSSLKASRLEQSQISQNFVRFSEVDKSEKKQIEYNEEDLRAMGIDMSPAEYAIYRKKKQALSSKRISPTKAVDISKVRNMLDNFQKMSNIDTQKQQSVFIEKSITQKPPSIKLQPVTIEQHPKLAEQKLNKSAKKQQKIAQDSQDLSEVLKLTVHSKMGSMHKKKFVTSDEDDERQTRRRIKKQSQRRSSIKKAKIQQSSQEQQQKFEEAVPQKIQSAYFKSVQWDNLDNYLTSHFKKMAKIFRKLNLLKKDQLLKSFEGYKSMMIIQVGSPEQPEGIVFVVQNQNKPSIRSLNIVHFGTYKAQDVLNVIIKTRDLLFNNDPCSEITFSMYYNKEDQEQDVFIHQFEKQFDPYGAIFQKKISNDQIERKHILRRMIGEASKPLVKNKAMGQLKVHQTLISHSNQLSLGVDLGLKKTGKDIGGWTVLSLFLSNFGKEEQIVKELTSDVLEKSKNVKHLSKMAMKLQNNRFADIEYERFQSPFETNLKFIELGVELVKCDPKIQENNIPMTVMRSNMTLTPVLPFIATTANFHYRDIEKYGKYLRLKCGKGSKVLKLKSSIYSSMVTVIPCKPNNYKILLMDANEFDEISAKTSLDLYIKLFLANISQHSHSTDQFIWIPQFTTEGNYETEYDQHFDLNTQLRNKVQLAFTQYVPNCTTFKPTHRDLLITPPFIIAVLNSDIEKCSEGSPAYLQRIDIADLVGVEDVPIPPPQSDF